MASSSIKTSWVTNNRSHPNVWIPCEQCDGRILFNREEIIERQALGTNTSTPCRHCGWHPAYPPAPWRPYDSSSVDPWGPL